ncbi:MAG: diadenylate cyclase [Candidatus Omnitrophota bacterium]
MIKILNYFIECVAEIGISGFVDMFFMSLLIYTFLAWFKRTRAAFVLKGIFIVLIVYLLARHFNLVMMAGLLEKFFAVFLIVLVIIFQEELRYFFEQVASWSLNREIFGVKKKILSDEGIEILSRTIKDFAREKTGALIVLQGKDIIVRHLDGGVDLNGELSSSLLESIFDPHSSGHDGAVVIVGRTVVKFSAHLPLSKNFDKLKKHGTRHAAALGMSELTDALCLVVSEEHGTISLARKGNIDVLEDPGELPVILEKFFNETNSRSQELFRESFLRRNTREKIYSIIFAVLLWFVLVHGSKLTYKNLMVPVTYAAIPAGWEVRGIEPKEIEVVLKGTRADFYFIKKERIKAFLNLKMVNGLQEVPVHLHNIILPKSVVLDSFEPHAVKVMLDHQGGDKN